MPGRNIFFNIRCFVVVGILFAEIAASQIGVSFTYVDEVNGITFDISEIRKFEIGSRQIVFANGARATINRQIIVKSIRTSDYSSMSGFVESKKIPFSQNLHLVTFNTVEASLANLNSLNKLEGVEYAHPNYSFEIEERQTQSPFNEPFFADQWHLENTGQRGGSSGEDIGVKDAWTRTTGKNSVIVSILDGGFEENHPDLINSWYVNSNEIPGNGMDDDANGLKDDVHGWNFSTNSKNLRYGFSPNHGTAVAGLIGASVNGEGGAGVCFNCKLLPIVFSKDLDTIISAFGYAYAHGASVISNSWGFSIGTPRTKALEETISHVAKNGRGGLGTTIIFAVNNAEVDACRGPEPDISAHPDVIAISSSDHNGIRIDEAAYGDCLKLLGPSSSDDGNGLTTTDRTGDSGYNTVNTPNNYEDKSYHNSFYGTSAAAPVIAGSFGLLYSVYPDLTSKEAEALMLKNATKISPSAAQYDPQTGHSRKYGYGRISVSFLKLQN
jgi:subtilisin family serine protease